MEETGGNKGRYRRKRETVVREKGLWLNSGEKEALINGAIGGQPPPRVIQKT